MDSLIKKFKGTISDSTLPQIGELKFLIDASGNYYPLLQFGANTAKKIAVEVDDCIIVSSSNVVVSNPFTLTTAQASYSRKPKSGQTGNKILSISNKYYLIYLGLNNVVESYVTLEDIVNYCPLTELLLDNVNILGDVMCLAAKNSITHLGITYNTSLNSESVRHLLNEMAKHRDNGTQLSLYISNGGGAGSLYDIPKAVQGSYYTNECTIYFTSDTTTYPNGWYGKTHAGVYYDSNDNVITP